MANNPEEANSIKGLFQGLVPDPGGVVQGVVKSVSPLTIQVEGDEKLLLNSSHLIVPRHLTDYSVTVSLSGGSVSGSTDSKSHTHSVSGSTDSDSHSHSISGSIGSGGDPEHSHSFSGSSGSDSHSHTVTATAESDSHSHGITSFAASGATLTVNNALKVGESVYLLSFNSGKQYYILDRAV